MTVIGCVPHDADSLTLTYNGTMLSSLSVQAKEDVLGTKKWLRQEAEV